MPALNELLEPYGAALGDMVLEGQLGALAGDTPWYASGANIVKWPAGGWLHSAVLTDKASEGASLSASTRPRVLPRRRPDSVPVRTEISEGTQLSSSEVADVPAIFATTLVKLVISVVPHLRKPNHAVVLTAV